MSKFQVSARARRDLMAIGRYTDKEWGRDQRIRYLEEIDRRFQLLATEPELGYACDFIREGYRRLPVGKHVIFYRKTAYGVRIIRILHEARDVKQHL